VCYDELLELVKSRRTIRVIKPDPVPSDLIEKALEIARWAPTGFNMQPAEFLLLEDAETRGAVKKIIDDWIEDDFYVLEATREAWQGPAWSLANRTRVACPAAPVYILVLGDVRRRAGLPMNARYCVQKGDSLFETSLADSFLYLWLGLHSLGLGAQPMSVVKNERPQALIKQLLRLPEFIYVYEMLAVGYSGLENEPPAKLVRHLDEIVHKGVAADGEFLSEEDLRKEIRKLRMGNVARHAPAGDGEK
jgi:5,6-dimethylbenzimidazole synthase